VKLILAGKKCLVWRRKWQNQTLKYFVEVEKVGFIPPANEKFGGGGFVKKHVHELVVARLVSKD